MKMKHFLPYTEEVFIYRDFKVIMVGLRPLRDQIKLMHGHSRAVPVPVSSNIMAEEVLVVRVGCIVSLSKQFMVHKKVILIED